MFENFGLYAKEIKSENKFQKKKTRKINKIKSEQVKSYEVDLNNDKKPVKSDFGLRLLNLSDIDKKPKEPSNLNLKEEKLLKLNYESWFQKL